MVLWWEVMIEGGRRSASSLVFWVSILKMRLETLTNSGLKSIDNALTHIKKGLATYWWSFFSVSVVKCSDSTVFPSFKETHCESLNWAKTSCFARGEETGNWSHHGQRAQLGQKIMAEPKHVTNKILLKLWKGMVFGAFYMTCCCNLSTELKIPERNRYYEYKAIWRRCTDAKSQPRFVYKQLVLHKIRYRYKRVVVVFSRFS